MKYPKQNIPIYCHLKNGNRTKGMFYMNGGKPTFVSYGTDISDSVIGWEYICPKCDLVGKKFRSKINGQIFVVANCFKAENGVDYYTITDEAGARITSTSCKWFENGIMQNLEIIE